MISIGGYQKTSLLDYPEHICTTVFLTGCNYNCCFCHNSSLLNQYSTKVIPTSEFLDFLTRRKGILEGVCVTGGEPTIHSELPEFLEKIKRLQYKIKLDTNGTNPTMMKQLVNDHLVDYVAMDIKTAPSHYGELIGIPSYNCSDVNTSVELLLSGSTPYEFRTTLVKEYHTAEIIQTIGQWIAGASHYYLQNYKESVGVLKKGLHSIDSSTVNNYLTLLQPYVPSVQLRGITTKEHSPH